MRRLLIIMAVVCAVVLVAAPVAAGRAADQEIADDTVLTLDDLPDGWTESPGLSVGELDPPECRRLRRATTRAQQRPHAESPSFFDPDHSYGLAGVRNAVFVFPKPNGAKRTLRPFKRHGEDCAISIGEELGESEVLELDVEDLGNAGVGYRIVFTGESFLTGEEVSVITDIVMVRVGRAIVSFQATSGEEPIPIGPDLLETVVDRVEEAL